MPSYLIAIVLIVSLIPWLALVLVAILWRDHAALRRRIEQLERSSLPAAEPIPPPSAVPAPSPVPPPSTVPRPSPVPPPEPVPTPSSVPGPPAVPAPSPLPPRSAVPAPSPVPAAAHAMGDRSRLEEQVGGIWMQNIGSVLLLLGAFFLIVWGYANGRIGPEVLVLAGVALGVVVVWRGYVIGRTLAPLGNAFIGIGLGVVYITLYLGHFRMHVFPAAVAFTLLAATSLVTVAIGLRRREPIIATLGVIAAYLPQFMAVWLPLQGFRLPLPALLGYFAVVNLVVFALAASIGWSGLVLLSLLLTNVTWSANAGMAPWGLPLELGLAALFVALGLAPVVRLARDTKPVRGVDLAVVAAAPMLLLLASWPFLTAPDRVRASLLLTGLAALYGAISVWLERRRAPRELWKALTAAGTVFLAAAAERGLLPEYLALAWCAEGMALLWLGLGPRGDWFRLLGYTILSVAAARLLYMFVTGPVPLIPTLLGAPALRDLIVIAVFLGASHLLGSRRSRLAPEERFAPGGWVFVANALLMIWIGREAAQLRHFLPQVSREYAVVAALTLSGAIWMVQALVLFDLSFRRDGPVLRHIGYFVAGVAALALVLGHAEQDLWTLRELPILNVPAAIVAIGTTLLILGAEHLWRNRARLFESEHRMPEVVTGVANVILLAWWAREARHLAAALSPPDPRLGPETHDRILAAVFTSAAWTLQAVVLFGLGWVRGSAFLRWSGLVLFGLTVLKFLLVDLDRVDAFWRFVSALGIGAALLVVSFLYQRKARHAAAPRGSAGTA
jgi:uncharacterized membrane protein